MYAFMKKFLFACLACVALVSCGGGGGAGIGGTGITASGSISGFGSIYVNGVRYDTSGANIIIDGVASQPASSLQLGMVVKVKGTLNSNGVDGTASSVSYEAEWEGPIGSAITTDPDNISKTFTVLGRTIVVNRNTTVFDAAASLTYDFNSIAQNDVVEINGYLDSANNRIIATRLKKEGRFPAIAQVDVKGTVSNYNGTNQFDIVINGTTLIIRIVSGTDLSDLPGGVISNGMNVEVKGTITTGTTINASKIEPQDSVFESGDSDVSLEGIVTGYVSNSNFVVNGVTVNASGASFTPSTLSATLANGMRVEVEGVYSGGVLMATEVESRTGEIKIYSPVTAVDTTNNRVTMGFASSQGTVTVQINNATRMKDELSQVQPFTVNNINTGNFLEIDAYLDGTTVTATDVKRVTSNPGGEVILQGSVTAVGGTTGAETVTILGITFLSDGSTQFEQNDVGISRSAFFAAAAGSVVKVKDVRSSSVTDGVAEEMEIEN